MMEEKGYYLVIRDEEPRFDFWCWCSPAMMTYCVVTVGVQQ